MHKILLVDDHQFVLDSLRLLARTMPTVEVVGSCKNGKEALRFIATNEVDLVLTDYQMPEVNGLELTGQIRDKYPNTKVILLTISDDANTVKTAFKIGVAGYLLKKAGINELKMAIETVLSGGLYYDQSVFLELTNPSKEVTESLLTKREIEIVKLIATEATTAEIANKLFISENTVESHRKHIIQKLGVRNSIGIAIYAVTNGLV